ncbi:hypothetical protein FRZ67_06640 [Panacibacter ginsenosidivorans]|uniref:Uncharacterized protein n=1 Tax=Panacibacter ginsenosidivorans TaxID=1813871 RepID=A0A5B8V664_9BACT|nr:choice-of-anchor X domain-containing protein [Panacibacter ginsenosidivorans]QEC66987.1 hypothetical protein FRZ67_06640 [Panacibacter ginsenosidivorans]
MKTSKQTIIVFGIALLTFAFISWDRNKQSGKTSDPAFSRIFSTNNTALPWVDDNDYAAYLADDNYGFDGTTDRNPPAEDVLVQKIPGDNYHLLLMAVYSFENYSGTSITVDNNGEQLVLRDDGQGFDKVAGDGIFTTKIFADVNEFRKTAMSLYSEAKKNGPQVQFYNRAIANPQDCNRGTFDPQSFDKVQAVSISDLIGGGNELIDSVRRNCIFITDLAVVEDPTRTWNPCTQTGNIDGPWTFKTIMKNLAKSSADVDPTDAELSDFVMKFLHNWQVQREINGDTVPPRPLITDKVITPWLEKSEAAGAPPGQLDMRFAPYKLTAIVNRFDIRERAAGIPAGEGRYTFCLIDSTCTAPLQATMVVEYGITSKNNCDSLQSWARRWYDLKDLVLGSPEYNAALEDITNRYTLWGSAPGRDSKIALDAIRTNELEFAPEDGSIKRYEFREFNLMIDPERKLFQKTVGQIPRDLYNAQVDNPDVRAMVNWINNNKRPIINDAYVIPDSINGQPFLGGHAQILGEPVGQPTGIYHWDGIQTKNNPARIKNTTARHVFSRNTCTGCHAGELQTFFTHVDPVFFGTEATLSGFLSGTAGRGGAIDFDNNPDNDSMMVRDAAGRGGKLNSLRMFNDILRRARDLKDFVLTPPCATTTTTSAANVFALRSKLMFKPLNSVH